MYMHERERGLLRQARLSVTQGRLAILGAFYDARVPLSAKRVAEMVAREVDMVTVYRALNVFVAKGILRKVDLRHNHAHYEIVDGKHHHHIICTQCGSIADIGHCRIEEMAQYIVRHTPTFAIVESHALEFFGICKKCAHKQRVAQ